MSETGKQTFDVTTTTTIMPERKRTPVTNYPARENTPYSIHLVVVVAVGPVHATAASDNNVTTRGEEKSSGKVRGADWQLVLSEAG